VSATSLTRPTPAQPGGEPGLVVRNRGRVWERLAADKFTLVAMLILAMIVLLAVFAPWLTTGEPCCG
jgi:hypothetical protein